MTSPAPRRTVQPARLPRFPRFVVCPRCHRGGGDDQAVISFVAPDMPEDSYRQTWCNYCGYRGGTK